MKNYVKRNFKIQRKNFLKKAIGLKILIMAPIEKDYSKK